MDLAGLTLQPTPDGGWMILGAAQHDGRSIAEGVQTGDILLEIDGFPVNGATMGTVTDKLRGSPGEKRTLVIEHNGVRTHVTATVRRLM
jgi:carboxyl-terminal processing protease